MKVDEEGLACLINMKIRTLIKDENQRNFLKQIGYCFNALQAASVVFMSDKLSEEEKNALYAFVLALMEDKKVYYTIPFENGDNAKSKMVNKGEIGLFSFLWKDIREKNLLQDCEFKFVGNAIKENVGYFLGETGSEENNSEEEKYIMKQVFEQVYDALPNEKCFTEVLSDNELSMILDEYLDMNLVEYTTVPIDSLKLTNTAKQRCLGLIYRPLMGGQRCHYTVDEILDTRVSYLKKMGKIYFQELLIKVSGLKNRNYIIEKQEDQMRILYLHGIGSGGNSRTPRTISGFLPELVVDAPELPSRPKEAIKFIEEYMTGKKYDMIIGTSLGGFYAQTVKGTRKILVNPAMYADEDIRDRIGLGKHKFLCSRTNGETEYEIDETFISELAEIREKIYRNLEEDAEEKALTFALFGNKDEVVGHYSNFCKWYDERNVIRFNGAHRLEEKEIKNILIPLVLKVLQE